MNFAASPYAKTESQRFDPMTTRGMVTSPHYLATQAGVDILRKGGTALDAAVAVAAVLAVVYPQMCSIGGDNFWLAHEAATGALHGITPVGALAKMSRGISLRKRALCPFLCAGRWLPALCPVWFLVGMPPTRSAAPGAALLLWETCCKRPSASRQKVLP